VEQAKLNGHVLGARMMGGGFGGCTINLIAKSATESFKKTVSEAYKNKFDKECSLYFVELSDGTGIIA
jgi:galactokinase